MFDDPQKELKKLEEQLLQQEMNDEEFERFYHDVFEEFGADDEEEPADSAEPRQPVKKASKTSTYADTPRAVAPKKKKGVKGLLITVCLESVGIIALVLYWVLRLF